MEYQCPYCDETFDNPVACDEHKRGECDERPLFLQ